MNTMEQRERKNAMTVKLALVAQLVFGAFSATWGWNYTETTRLGWLSQGYTSTQTDIVLNWRSSDSSSSLQSFYVTIPANSILDVDVSCAANGAMLYVEVVPNTIGFSRSVSLPGLTPRQIIEKMKTVKMVDVVMPTTDGRVVTLPRYVEPKEDVALLLGALGLTLPAQPPPKISGNAAPQKTEV